LTSNNIGQKRVKLSDCDVSLLPEKVQRLEMLKDHKGMGMLAAKMSRLERFPWCSRTTFQNIPDDIQRKMTEYMTDDELFGARSINIIFYAAFFEQRVISRKSRKFNYNRALQLAGMGRVFKNLLYFWTEGTNDDDFSRYFNTNHFPKVEFLDVTENYYVSPQRNQVIRKIRGIEHIWF